MILCIVCKSQAKITFTCNICQGLFDNSTTYPSCEVNNTGRQWKAEAATNGQGHRVKVTARGRLTSPGPQVCHHHHNNWEEIRTLPPLPLNHPPSLRPPPLSSTSGGAGARPVVSPTGRVTGHPSVISGRVGAQRAPCRRIHQTRQAAPPIS